MKFTLMRQKDSPLVYPIYHLRYLDQILWFFRGRKTKWTPDGRLCQIVPQGENFWAVEVPTHFPSWYIMINIHIKLGWMWTTAKLKQLFNWTSTKIKSLFKRKNNDQETK